MSQKIDYVTQTKEWFSIRLGDWEFVIRLIVKEGGPEILKGLVKDDGEQVISIREKA